MALTIKIEADKDGFTRHLLNQAGEHREHAKNAAAKDVKARLNGIAEGLSLAASYVESWTILDYGPADPAALGRADGDPGDGRVHDDGPGPHPQYMT